MAKGEEIPRTNPAEIEHLIKQIRGTNLDPAAKDKIERLLRTVLSLVELLQRKNTSIKKLRELIFGKRTEKQQARQAAEREKPDESKKSDQALAPASGDREVKSAASAGEGEEKPGRKGHGHRAVSEYSGARVVKCPHPQLKAGDAGPALLCGGRVYDLHEPTALLQFTRAAAAYGDPLRTGSAALRQMPATLRSALA